MEQDLLDDQQQTSIRFYYNLTTLKIISLAGASLVGFLCLLRVIFLVMLIPKYQPLFTDQAEYDSFVFYANTADMLEVASMFAGLLALIPFFMWLYRAYYNLEVVRLKGLNVTAGWAVGWFFIPFANLYYSVVVLNDLMRGTKHLYLKGSVMQSIAYTPVVPIGIFWLLSNIFSSIFSSVGTSMIEHVAAGSSFKTGMIVLIFSDVFSIINAAIEFYLVYWVSKKQLAISQEGI